MMKQPCSILHINAEKVETPQVELVRSKQPSRSYVERELKPLSKLGPYESSDKCETSWGFFFLDQKREASNGFEFWWP